MTTDHVLAQPAEQNETCRKGKRVAVLQSNYIPWKGYFDIINAVDEFVVYDIVQYTKNDWRNRNRIKTPGGLQWLTIPVSHQRLGQSILETRVANSAWREKHWKTLCQYYSKAPHFDRYRPIFEPLYVEHSEQRLSEINLAFIRAINRILGIETNLSLAQDYCLGDGKIQRLLDLCKQIGATHYLSGPAARDYLDVSRFNDQGIGVTFVDYEGYPPYQQFHPPFVHQVSVLDLIFQEGPDAPSRMKSFTQS